MSSQKIDFFHAFFEPTLAALVDKSFVGIILTMMLVIYGSKALPHHGKLPKKYMLILNSFPVRIIIISLIVFKISNKDIPFRSLFSIIISSCFLLVFDSISYLENDKKKKQIEKFSSEDIPKVASYPSCKNKPIAGKDVQQFFKDTDTGKCQFIYSIPKYNKRYCTAMDNNHIKFCENNPDPLDDEELDGCYKIEPDENDTCRFTYKKK